MTGGRVRKTNRNIIPEGYSLIGSMSAVRLVHNKPTAVLSRSRKGTLSTGLDESGSMGLDQGDAYLIEASVVSDWDLYGSFALPGKKDYYRKGNKLTLEEFEKFFENVQSVVLGVHVLAIRKDSVEPSAKVMHDIHAGGLATVAEQVLRTERADRVEATIDFTTQIQPEGLDRRIFEQNPYGRDVSAVTDHAKVNPGLTSNDYITYAVSEWIRNGNYSYLELSGLNLHYCVTDFKTMQKIGGRVSHELNHGNTYRPIGITDWSDIDLSLGKMGPETHIVGRTDDSGKGYAPHYTGTRKKDRSSGLDDIISDSRKTFKPHTGSHRPRKSGGDCTSLSKVISKPGNAPTHQYRKPASKPTTGRFAARAVSTARVSERRDSKGSRDSSRSPRTGDSRFRKRH